MALLTSALAGLLVLLLVGSWIYCVLTAIAARRYLAISPRKLKIAPPISVLKPLCGQDDRLEENLRSFFTQDYPDYEILFAVHSVADPAVAVVHKVRSEFPLGPRVHLIETGEPAVPNAKAHSLRHLVALARHSILVMSDSDVHVPPNLLERVAAEFQAAEPESDKLKRRPVGVVTCPYRAEPGQGFWSQLEAIGMNTEFLAGVLVAWLIGEMDFALGPTLAASREAIEAMGGFADLGHYLAEDFVIGNRAPRLGYRVILSSCVIDHRIGSQTFKGSLQHRLRWAPSRLLGRDFHQSPPARCAALARCAKAVAFVSRHCSLSCAGRVEHRQLDSARPAHQTAMVADSTTRSNECVCLGRGIFRQHHRLAWTAIQTLTRRPLSIRRNRAHRNRRSWSDQPSTRFNFSSVRNQSSKYGPGNSGKVVFR